LPDLQLDNLNKVLISADHLLRLINTILDIAKIEAGRMDIQPYAFTLPPLIDLVVSTTRPLLQPGVEIITTIEEDLPAMYTDQEKLKQILINLLGNAAKFTHHGNVMISVSKEVKVLHIEVADTGIGMSPEQLSQVFEEFYQADLGVSREYGGTGLGLSISRSLARLLGGDIRAKSQVGIGTTFIVSIPIRYGGEFRSDTSQKYPSGSHYDRNYN
jgi:signal transduction histidine kinase